MEILSIILLLGSGLIVLFIRKVVVDKVKRADERETNLKLDLFLSLDSFVGFILIIGVILTLVGLLLSMVIPD